MTQNWDYEKEWFEETNVAKKMVDWLTKNGYNVIRSNIKNKRQKGYDIEAEKGQAYFIFEVKGFPSEKYVSGTKKGLKKPTPSNLQARHWFADALFSLIIAKSNNPSYEIGVVLPNKKKYLDLINQISYFRSIFRLHCFLVEENGDVKHIDPESTSINY
ncbi:MAG: hypothetical protein ABDH23_01780 [Endomicrobiia bacterium]